MKNRIVTIIGLFALLSTASAAGPKADFNVIPVPRTICAGTSAPFVLDSNTKIYYEEGQKRNAAFLQQYITDITGIVPELTDRPRKRGTISLRVKDTSSDAEGYTLTVDKKTYTSSAILPQVYSMPYRHCARHSLQGRPPKWKYPHVS